MTLMATVAEVTTRTKVLPGETKFDIVQLSYQGRAFLIDTPVKQLTEGQDVAVEATSLDGTGFPRNLRLSS